MRNTRRIAQVLFLLFFILLFLKARYPYSDALPSDIMLRFSPLVPVFDFIANLRISLLFWPALLILLLTPFLGRFFCGWICPLGTTLDSVSHLVNSPDNRKSIDAQKWRSLKFILLAGFIVLAIFSVPVWGHFDPLSLFNRALTVVLYPVFTLFSESTLEALARVRFMEEPVFAVFDFFKTWIMPEDQAQMQQVFWIALLFGGILALEKVTRRFWCRNLCPAGALLGFLSQFRFYERLVADSCPQCGKCTRECKMNAISEDDATFTNKVECIECFNCGIACPPKIDAITYRWRWKPYRSSIDYSRRQFLGSTVGGLGVIGLASIGLDNKKAKARVIRPPGSLPENEFLDQCIRCMECVRICQSNGRCLQASGVTENLEDVWTPIGDMRTGYCEFNCNLCGEVCPTEAILPLALERKKQTAMGLAYFDKDLCIPYAKNEDCIVCEEHCPTPDKAIKFDEKEYIAPDGSRRMVKYPYVDEDLCIGCGICENKCPLKGEAGIYITNEKEDRLTKEELAKAPSPDSKQKSRESALPY